MKKENKPSVNYATDGRGRWWRTEIAPQCPDEDILCLRCQGVDGHKGVHWAYKPEGSYAYWLNNADPSSIEHDVGAGWIPPDHESYVHPVDKQKEYFMSFRQTIEIEDQKLIEKLENDETPEADASVDRPVTDEELAQLKDRGVL